LVGTLVGGVSMPPPPLRVGPPSPLLLPLPPLPLLLSLPLPPHRLNFQKLINRHVQVVMVAKIRVINTDINIDDINPSGGCRGKIECTTLGHEKWQIAKLLDSEELHTLSSKHLAIKENNLNSPCGRFYKQEVFM
jgi:hypothetical protein